MKIAVLPGDGVGPEVRVVYAGFRAA